MLAVGGALGIAFAVYAPALRGPFLFDDLFLPYAVPERAALPLASWIAGVRPVLYFSFWLNRIILGSEPAGYHAVNVAIHALNSFLVFWITARLLQLAQAPARTASVLSVFAAAIFLLHPVQTESVAYIASRSETLSAFFVLAALGLFVRRLPGRITWLESILILVLFAAGCAAKEQAVVLAPALLLADYFWNPAPSLWGVRRNWRLYVPLAAAACAAAPVVWKTLANSLSAGFGLPGVTWYQYFFTECRAFFTYLRLFLFPAHQTADYDFPISRTILEHGSIYGLLGILALLAFAITFRRRYRLACFGILLAMLCLAPTSSFVPLRDPVAEHRMYLAVFALSLVALEALSRIRIPRRQLARLCIVLAASCGVAAYARNHVWSDSELLWRDAVRKSPNKLRPYTNLTLLYMDQNRCREAATLLEGAPPALRANYYFLVELGEAEGCLSRFDRAAELLAQGAALHPDAHVYLRLGMMRANAGQMDAAYEAFNRAIQLNPSSDEAYTDRGHWYERTHRYDLAAGDYRRALQLNPDNHTAKVLLEVAERRLHSDAVRAE